MHKPFFIRALNFPGKPGSNIFTMKKFYQEISRNDPEFPGLEPPERHFIDPGEIFVFRMTEVGPLKSNVFMNQVSVGRSVGQGSSGYLIDP